MNLEIFSKQNFLIFAENLPKRSQWTYFVKFLTDDKIEYFVTPMLILHHFLKITQNWLNFRNFRKIQFSIIFLFVKMSVYWIKIPSRDS